MGAARTVPRIDSLIIVKFAALLLLNSPDQKYLKLSLTPKHCWYDPVMHLLYRPIWMARPNVWCHGRNSTRQRNFCRVSDHHTEWNWYQATWNSAKWLKWITMSVALLTLCGLRSHITICMCIYLNNFCEIFNLQNVAFKQILNFEGYSDLVWMGGGGCAAQASKSIPIFKDHFGRKKVPICTRHFSWNTGPFLKILEKMDSCLGISL